MCEDFIFAYDGFPCCASETVEMAEDIQMEAAKPVYEPTLVSPHGTAVDKWQAKF
jgi:hypothetical protein